MDKEFFRALVIIASAIVLPNCATPTSRISEQPQVFSQATPEQQALIRQGRIAIGFKPEFVKLALGEPDRITERTDSSGTETTWHYTEVEAVPYAGYSYYDPMLIGPLFGPPYWSPYIWAAPPPSVETDKLRVFFRSGSVSAIERVVK